MSVFLIVYRHAKPILCLAVLWACLVAADAKDTERRPNIVLILADDLGYSDLGCYGGEITTPNLDALAAGGLRMTQLYNTARCCSTRASLLTGLYPHQAGVGAMTADLGLPGYRGFLTDRSATVATVLREAGYQTFLSGKWHLRGAGDPDCIPTNRGFDRFYGHFKAYASFYRPDLFVHLPAHKNSEPNDPNFYATNAITDQALRFINQARHADSSSPYFLYLAYNAPHFPLHAPKDLIDKWVKQYVDGWDALRLARHRRMIEMGIVSRQTTLTPRGHVTEVPNRNRDSPYYGKQIPAWNSLPEDRRRDLARRMATYAAMVEIMDRNIGRVVNDLRENDELDNTLIVFLSDNGACAEWDPYGFDNNPYPTNKLYRDEELDEIGQPGTFHSYGTGWANACNTPFRLYKHYCHEGGISAPCIVHWPDRIERAGEIDRQPAHLVDLSATLLDAGGGTYLNAPDVLPAAGISLLPIWERSEVLRERPLYFEHEGNRAIRLGKWKAVWTNFNRRWELYDILSDRTELDNLADQNAERVGQLSKMWDEWAAASFVENRKIEPPAEGMPKIYYMK